VLYFETGMFFVGLAALILKLQDLVQQSVSMGRIELPAGNAETSGENGDRMLKQLCGLPKSVRSSYLVQRLVNIFEFVDRKRNADGLDDELKYLADQDAVRQQESYSLVRIVAWATPMLGFLGTVIGITQALGDLDPKLFATDMNRAMQGLLSGLYVAFDTTALALVLSMVLMFLMFFADRIESQLLAGVDSLVNDEVAGWFPGETGRENPYLKSVEKMSHAVIKTTETLIRQQTDQWQVAMASSTQQLGLVAEATGQQVRLAIGESLDHSLKNHAERLARFEFEADQQMRARWDQWQSALADNVRIVRDQQSEVVKQTELITKISQATGEVIGLEKTLNQNLNALAGAKNFEETVLSLSAAIQLLSVKLSHLPDRSPAVDLRSSAQGKAA
jgi:biopolymer transport protein ExbB/TolQ